MCETLERKGYQTFGAGSGDEAFAMLSKAGGGIDLVITDYHMPDCTGHDLLVMMKADKVTARIPVIFLTTELSPEKMKQSKEAGLSAWIKKPYRSEAFFATIHEVLQNEN